MTRLFSKPYMQELLKGLRKAGYTVKRTPGQYLVFIDEGDETPVLTALNGTRNYLVTYDPKLLTEEA